MNRRVRALAGWILLSVFVVSATARLDWEGLGATLRDVTPGWLVLAVGANALILVLGAAQWLLFVPSGSRVGPRRMFTILAVTASVSNGGPTLAGHATGIHLLATHGGLGHAGGVSVTVLDQVAEGLAKWLLVVLGAALIPGFQYRGVGLTVLVGVPLLTFASLALAFHGSKLAEWGGTSAGWRRRSLTFVADAAHRLEALRRPWLFSVGVLMALLQKAAEALGMALAAAALGVSLPPWAVVAALVAVNLSVLVSVTPANLGIYEGAAFLVFRSAGLETHTALALALLCHAVYLLPLAATGWILVSAGALKESDAEDDPVRVAEGGNDGAA